MTLHVYYGHEDRVEAGSTAFVRSVVAHARKPIALHPISRQIVDAPEGTNAFTYRRFLVPYWQDYRGWAVFVDGADMICRGDINELMEYNDYYSAVQVVQHSYATKHPRKYLGTPMEADNPDYPRKNWASVMLINCAHFAWREITPDFVQRADPMHLLQLRFIRDSDIGPIPVQWNWLVDEYGPEVNAKLLHYTAGVPGIAAHADAPMADEWRAHLAAANSITG